MTETAKTVQRGRWYPSPAPALDGEEDGYTDRLTGADGTNRQPYDHPRNRQCSIGWHMECSDPAGKSCKCPCHEDRKYPVGVRAETGPELDAAAAKIAELYGLPARSGVRVMLATRAALDYATTADGSPDAHEALRDLIKAAYGSELTDGFLIDAVNLYIAAMSGRLNR